MWFNFQQLCGFEYTSKLQRMFQDMNVSRDLNDSFKKHLTATEPLDSEYYSLLTFVSKSRTNALNLIFAYSSTFIMARFCAIFCMHEMKIYIIRNICLNLFVTWIKVLAA